MDKIIHQIWIGENEMPQKIKNYTDSIKTMNPNYEYKLWGNELFSMYNNNPLFKNFSKGANNIKAHLADIYRLLILRDFGGIYCDVDMMPIKSFDLIWDTIHNYDIVFTSNKPSMITSFTNNSFIYCKKNGFHVNRICSDEFCKTQKFIKTFNFKIVDIYIKSNNDKDIFILPYYYVQPEKDDIRKETIAIHDFMGSWKKERRDIKKSKWMNCKENKNEKR